MDLAFKVFHCGNYFRLGEIYAVITGHIEKDNSISTEWYYLVIGDQKAWGNGLTIHADFFSTIEEFWNAETKTSLKNAIFYKELVPASERTDDARLTRNVELNEIDKSTLFRIKTDHPGFIDLIEKNTKCTDIQEYIKMLRRIIIQSSPIPYAEFKI